MYKAHLQKTICPFQQHQQQAKEVEKCHPKKRTCILKTQPGLISFSLSHSWQFLEGDGKMVYNFVIITVPPSSSSSSLVVITINTNVTIVLLSSLSSSSLLSTTKRYLIFVVGNNILSVPTLKGKSPEMSVGHDGCCLVGVADGVAVFVLILGL